MRSPRRPGRRGALVVLVTAVLLAACGTAGAPTSGGAPDVVMVIRHAEKPSGGEPGVDARGAPDDNSLTATGWRRANALVDLFTPANGAPRPGLARPTVIYAAGANDDGEGLRPRETVAPLAARLGITVNTDYGKGDEKKLVERATARRGVTLISWQHEEIPDIAKAFDSVSPKPPKDWPDSRFDVVWTFTRTADGWRFDQVPELVLPGDRDTGIHD